MMMGRRTALLCLGLTLDAAPAFADEPRDLVTRVYALYEARKGGEPAGMDYDHDLDWIFTPGLAAMIRADGRLNAVAGELGYAAIEADIFVQGHDVALSDVEILDRVSGDGAADVTVSMVNGGRAQTMHLELVETSAGWRIDDMIWEEGTPLRDQILANAEAVAGPLPAADPAREAACLAEFAAGRSVDYLTDFDAVAAAQREIAACIPVLAALAGSRAASPPKG